MSEGARLTWLAMGERGWCQADLRRQLRARSGGAVAPGVVGRWLYGDRRPGLLLAVQLEALLGVPVASWHQRPRGRVVFPAAAKRAA